MWDYGYRLTVGSTYRDEVMIKEQHLHNVWIVFVMSETSSQISLSFCEVSDETSSVKKQMSARDWRALEINTCMRALETT